MINFTVISVNHQTPQWIQNGIQEYHTRIKPYANLDLIEIKRQKYPSGMTPDQIRAKDTQHILNKIPKQALPIVCDPKGKNLTSLNFSDYLKNIFLHHSKLCFLVGSPYGFDQDLIQNFQKISLSSLTFPHELTRVILIEQIYRGLTIHHHHPYHL